MLSFSEPRFRSREGDCDQNRIRFGNEPSVRRKRNDRTGYLWLKTRTPEAMKIRTRSIELPEVEAFRRNIETLRETDLGGRLYRPEYQRLIEERDREWLDMKEELNVVERFEKKYAEERSAWQA